MSLILNEIYFLFMNIAITYIRYLIETKMLKATVSYIQQIYFIHYWNVVSSKAKVFKRLKLKTN